MKTTLTCFAGIGLLAALGAAQPQPRYTMTDLGTLETGDTSFAFDMNNAGWMVGQSNLTPGGTFFHTFIRYRGGPLVDIGTLNGLACPTCNIGANGPNGAGQVPVAYETSATDPNGEDFCQYGTHRKCLGAIWKNGAQPIQLPNLPGGNNANTFGINNVGQVVGFAENGVKDSCTTPFQVFRFQPVIWNPDGAIHKVLQPYSGDTVAFAFGINDRGQTVGASGLCSNTTLPPMAPGGPHAVLWESDGTPVDLGNLGGPIAVATSINERGDVVGGAVSGDDGAVHTFLWTRQTRKMQDLGTIPGAVATVAPCCNTINNRREVVGIWFDSNGPAGAFLWRDGDLMELSTLIPQGSPWSNLQAVTINDAGEIAGWGTINGETHAFVAKPVAEQSVHEEDQAKPQMAAPARRPADSRTLPLGRIVPRRR